jgi:hypothetical protein
MNFTLKFHNKKLNKSLLKIQSKLQKISKNLINFKIKIKFYLQIATRIKNRNLNIKP